MLKQCVCVGGWGASGSPNAPENGLRAWAASGCPPAHGLVPGPGGPVGDTPGASLHAEACLPLSRGPGLDSLAAEHLARPRSRPLVRLPPPAPEVCQCLRSPPRPGAPATSSNSTCTAAPSRVPSGLLPRVWWPRRAGPSPSFRKPFLRLARPGACLVLLRPPHLPPTPAAFSPPSLFFTISAEQPGGLRKQHDPSRLRVAPTGPRGPQGPPQSSQPQIPKRKGSFPTSTPLLKMALP